MIKKIRQMSEALFPKLQEIRRHLHAHPELSFHEYETAKYVALQLDKLQIPYTSGVAGTGIVAVIEGNNPSKRCIALRADMDALPITEANEVPYKSQNEGCMHACGHDAHTTCLLGAAMILQELKDTFEGTVKLIFQPGEEKNPGGASLMIAEGVLDQQPKPEAIFGLHVYPQLPAGHVGFRPGKYMASADELYITIKGNGGHAALPQQTIDPIAITAVIITALQQVVSRKSDPLMPTVLTFGKIAGGHTTNVIPEQVVLEGTLRTLDEVWRKAALSHIKRISTQIAAAYGATAVVDIPEGYPCLHNDPDLTANATALAIDFLGAEQVHALDLRMGAEDFSFYTQKIPGCFYRIGTNTRNESHMNPVHNAHFDIDEQALVTGAGMMSWLAINTLNK